MQDEADIIINGTKLTDAQSMTVRVAVDTLANVLAEGLSLDGEDKGMAERYASSLSAIQDLLDSRAERTQ